MNMFLNNFLAIVFFLLVRTFCLICSHPLKICRLSKMNELLGIRNCLSSFWYRNPRNTQGNTVAVGCLPENDSKELLLKQPCTLDIGVGRFELDLQVSSLSTRFHGTRIDYAS